MSILNSMKAAIRTARAGSHQSANWEKYVKILYIDEADLLLAVKAGRISQETMNFAQEVIELQIQGRPIAKTRWKWASFEWGQMCGFAFPYRSYDSDKTKGVNIDAALADLISLNRSTPNLSLDELKQVVCRKYWT